MTDREIMQAALDALTSEDIVCSGCTGGSVGNMCCREQQWDAAKAIRARLAQQQNEDECRRTCKALCAGTGDTGGDWPCVKQRGNHD